MKSIYMILLMAICLVVHAQSQNIPVVFTDTNCGSFCKSVQCLSQTIEECDANQVLLPADGDCNCSAVCGDREKLNNEDNCNPEDCHLMDCDPKVTPDFCLYDNDMAFVPRDGKCLCCNLCVAPQARPE